MFIKLSALLGLIFISLLAGFGSVKAADTSRKFGKFEIPKANLGSFKFPSPTDKGFLDVHPDHGSKMYYNYFEAESGANRTTPIVLWLQGGPGCSSFFGMFYINGPYFVNSDLTLSKNLGSWNRIFGLLYIEQPIGVGFSKTGTKRIPSDEVEVARDLYLALQLFYKQNPEFAMRPLIIAGESYAGKYVPSISHFIVQAAMESNGSVGQLKRRRNIGKVEPPVFPFGGMAIGNGFTDAETQTMYQAEVAYSFGLIDRRQRLVAESMQYHTLDLVLSENYAQARAASDALLAYINGVSGTATLEDVRRNLGYDGWYNVDAYLNQPEVQEFLGVLDENVTWSSCAPEVDRALRHDVMRSVKKLVADIIKFHPALFYQGQFDGECGVASNDAWLDSMQWEGHSGFRNADRRFWLVNDRIAGFWKQYKSLSHVMIRNAGHMVPHDNPLLGQVLIEKWITERVQREQYQRHTSPAAEAQMIAVIDTDVGEHACCQPIPKPPPSIKEEQEVVGDGVRNGLNTEHKVVRKSKEQILERIQSSGFGSESDIKAMERFFAEIEKAAPRDEELKKMRFEEEL
uniref:Carboxypeptidase n=1 Tax=Polytomella parva TaxID=51329 RepID=A0A7S0VCK6_9CHLO|mmetsp:Transcript_32932/g.59620  ORF Transcript_32932/g.59620 Transcript_32932/m.59620 type:complete len:572 (+) Transcript_32932:74-1789(+)